jgi:propanediol dehydratase medium subunit
MEINEKLVEQIVKAIIENVNSKDLKNQDKKENGSIIEHNTALGKTPAKKGTNPKEVVIGVGPAFQTDIHNTISGISLDDVLSNIKAGIEEEGMEPRVVKVFKTSDVAFIGLEVAKLSGSGIGIGLQSKGTAIIHQKDLYPLSNLELFPQAPLLSLETYRKIGKNAAKYAKGEKVSPIEGQNDPMTRAKYQVKAALMHIKETEQVNKNQTAILW